LFPYVTLGEKKIFSALSLSSVTFTLPDYTFIECVIVGKLLHPLPYFGVSSDCWFTTRSLQSCQAVNHITELLLDFTDMKSAFDISITVVLVVSKDWRENSFERNSRDKF